MSHIWLGYPASLRLALRLGMCLPTRKVEHEYHTKHEIVLGLLSRLCKVSLGYYGNSSKRMVDSVRLPSILLVVVVYRLNSHLPLATLCWKKLWHSLVGTTDNMYHSVSLQSTRWARNNSGNHNFGRAQSEPQAKNSEP